MGDLRRPWRPTPLDDLPPATVDDPEEIRKRIHQLRIKREREIGLAYVRKAARQGRRELGIEP